MEIRLVANSHARRVHRGDIVRVDFNPIRGSEQAGIRPALVVSPEILNRGDVIVVAPITSKNTDRVFPWEALIEAGNGGLPLQSKVMFRHLRGVTTERLVGSYGSVTRETMDNVEAPLRLAVGLDKI